MEGSEVRRHPQGLTGGFGFPLRQWRRPDALVEGGVMLEDDGCHHPLQFRQGEAGIARRVVHSPLLDIGEGGAR